MIFAIIYAKSVIKDIKQIPDIDKKKIKKEIEELQLFPNVNQVKKLTSHAVADYRLKIGTYRVLFDVDWDKREIQILKIGHRKDIY